MMSSKRRRSPSLTSLAILSAGETAGYRELLKQLLVERGYDVLDLNDSLPFHAEQELIDKAVHLSLSKQAELVVLLSESGNELQMKANKYDGVRAAPILGRQLIPMLVHDRVTMCEVGTLLQLEETAAELIDELACELRTP
jgi:Ribose/Galactose Isomerase